LDSVADYDVDFLNADVLGELNSTVENRIILPQVDNFYDKLDLVVDDPLFCSIDSSDSNDEDDDNENYEASLSKYYTKLYNPPKKTANIFENIINSPDVSAALDRTNISDRKFTYLAGAIAKATNTNIATCSISRATVKRKRTDHRETLAKLIDEEFKKQPETNLVVHWDGKIMTDSTNTENFKQNCDRIAVVVSGLDVTKVLGIPKASSGSGEAQATVTYDLLKKWDLVDKIVGMSFDTTSSNTGVYKGACTLLEQLLGKKVLNLACRHHIHELMVEKSFEVLFEETNSPEVKLLKYFQKNWANIDHHNFKALKDTRLNLPFIRNTKTSVVVFLNKVLENPAEYCPRDDYKEICELTLLILGEPARPNYRFKLPGACHHARWMAKVIFCL
jgi:hypothetical protein